MQEEKFAVIADVHGNLEALNKALAIIKNTGINKIFFLGDAVGYGANPIECFNVLKQNCAVMLMGNHEAMCIDGNQKKSSLCEESFEWTKQHIDENLIEVFKRLPYSHFEDELSFFHACSNNSLYDWPYLNDKNDVIESFKNAGRVCFYGHTHRPRVIIEGQNVRDIMIKKTSSFVINLREERAYINPGSVGQSRDGRTDLSFAICEMAGDLLKVRIERHRYNSLKSYMKVRFSGCGISNANYLIRERWRKELYERVGNWGGWIYRKICM